MEVKINKAKLAGRIKIPASKSHTIRAVLIASLASGKSTLLHPLDSEDTRACMTACRQLGAVIQTEADKWIIQGTGGQLKTPKNVIDTGNSGSTIRFLTSTATLCDGWTVLTGDEQIIKRPIQPLLQSLNDLGAQAFSTRNNGCAPVVVKGKLKGGKTKIKCPTSQYLTSLLINCPLAEKNTEIQVLELNEKPYVQITLDWLDRQQIKYQNQDMQKFFIKGNQQYKAFKRSIPGDFSSATFFLCAAAITGSRITLEGLDINDSQGDKAVLDMLKQMGCDVNINTNEIIIKGGELKAMDLDLNSTPDALPALAVTACFARGTSRLYNVPQARLKETDRIAAMKKELTKMGAKVEELPDALVITGSPLKGTKVHGYSDHRIVMALSIAGLAAQGTTVVDTTECVNITFPNFFELLEKIKK